MNNENNVQEATKKENILNIGTCTLDELENRIKSFQTMNHISKKKRYIVTREPIFDANEKMLLEKAEDFDIGKIKLLKRSYKGNHVFKTFSPDEGIVIISDMSTSEGIRLSMELVTQIMNLGGGSYEAFIDRVDNFSELVRLYNKGLFPKLIIIGYLIPAKFKMEDAQFEKVKEFDPFTRFLEITHSEVKVKPLFPHVKQINIQMGDESTWKNFILNVIVEYTRSYLVDEKS